MITTTLPERRDDGDVRRARTGRRVGMGLLAAFVLLGLLGVLGTRTATVSDREGPYALTVTYPEVSRSGLAVTFEVQVVRAGGFPAGEPVRIRFLDDYFALFDENGFSPQPDTETADERWVLDEFTAPGSDTLTVSVDTRIEPARNRGADGEVQVLDADGRVAAAVSFHTYLVP